MSIRLRIIKITITFQHNSLTGDRLCSTSNGNRSSCLHTRKLNQMHLRGMPTNRTINGQRQEQKAHTHTVCYCWCPSSPSLLRLRDYHLIPYFSAAGTLNQNGESVSGGRRTIRTHGPCSLVRHTHNTPATGRLPAASHHTHTLKHILNTNPDAASHHTHTLKHILNTNPENTILNTRIILERTKPLTSPHMSAVVFRTLFRTSKYETEDCTLTLFLLAKVVFHLLIASSNPSS